MAAIELLAVENSLSRSKQAQYQVLQFWLVVENRGYDKQVEVYWAGRDGVWQTLSAAYQARRGDGREYWLARVSISNRSGLALPGAVNFALRLRYDGGEIWDNNGGWNYHAPARSGVALAAGLAVQNLAIKQRLEAGQHYLQIKVATRPAQAADKVVIHWSDDNWRTSRQTACRRNRRAKQHSAQIWTARLPVEQAFALEYCLCYRSKLGEVWDNNHGKNYRLSREPLRVLILNLHCYQEDRQDVKLSQIAKAIDEQAVDVVCFQEVAEHWNHGHGDWASNSANIINRRLRRPMHIHTDWSHLGFDKYREGVAILSRYPFRQARSRYVSDSQDPYSIHARKVVMAQLDIPYMGVVNVYSAHLSWWEDGFQHQFERLCAWADSQLGGEVKTTLLCGDFNVAAGSAGYRLVVDGRRYEDQYLAANQIGLFEKIFRVNDAHWQHLLADDYRIDYIFMNKSGDLRVTSARVLFTDWDYGRVSDHCGYLMSFEPK
ncbi:endonuclease/exonuclease/phosphatase family protein [Methylomonas rhizoryzae]|uniref:endonuclease/exonuclease/phosphatase family protein n=1 Tax=Methylomonas rhizoryzae TaxID=2608981 RepID=UPI001232B24A|nr:endonuclease/exonuclease/phosphatase family protein [Methylomonas rhizoryzae]